MPDEPLSILLFQKKGNDDLINKKPRYCDQEKSLVS